MPNEDFDRAATVLRALHADADSTWGVIDMGAGKVSAQAEIGINELYALLPKVDQGKLAEDFFSSTTAQQNGIHEAYQVYLALKDTEFARRFKELESLRLKESGQGEFTL
jgi:hypothetical protein